MELKKQITAYVMLNLMSESAAIRYVAVMRGSFLQLTCLDQCVLVNIKVFVRCLKMTFKTFFNRKCSFVCIYAFTNSAVMTEDG